jgi:hypothetical protein
MKLRHLATLASVLVLAACGGGKLEGDVRFIGFAPVTSKDKDVREVRTFCPGVCREPIAVDTARCTNKRCKAEIHWSNDYRCPSCQGTGHCSACSSMEQTNGECYNCKGQGVLIYAGQSPECPNCKGTKKCPVCKGFQKCDYCDGTGKIGKDIVKAKAAKFVGGTDGLPDSDPRPPVEKKDEAPKDAPKDDAKKDAPKEDEKK